MNTPKNQTISFLIFKYAMLSLYVIIPILAFLLGIQYQEYTFQRTKLVPSPLLQQMVTPSAAIKQQPPPYGKVTIQGTVDEFSLISEHVDGPPTLRVRERNGVLFDILLPAGESSCPFNTERNETEGRLKKGDIVEVYGTAATNERIIVCQLDEYVKILAN